VRFVYIFYVSEHWELSWHIGHIVYCRKRFLIDKLIFLIHIDWIILRILIISWENFIILDFNCNWDDNTIGFVRATLFYIGFRFLQWWSNMPREFSMFWYIKYIYKSHWRRLVHITRLTSSDSYITKENYIRIYDTQCKLNISKYCHWSIYYHHNARTPPCIWLPSKYE